VPATGRDVITFNTIIRAEAQAGCWDQVRVLLAEMKEQKIASNHVTFNTLLHACVTQKGKPWPFLEAMQAQGLRPDAITLTTVLRSVTARDAVHVRRCLSILDAGISQPDEALFSSLLEAAARTNDRSLVSSAVEVSARYGFPQQNALAAMLRSSSTFAEARALWEGLEAPTEAEYAAMVGWCCTTGDMNEARELFERARANGLVGMPTYQLLVKAYAQRKELEPAWELYGQLRDRGEPLPLALFNSLLDVCSRVGDMNRAEELWRAMPLLGVEPDLISFSTLVKGYCVQGDLEQALATFTQLRRRGLQADAILYHSILDGCANRQMVQLAEQILQDMIADGHKPTSITLSILVKLYGRTSLEQALQVFADLPAQYDFTPNAQVFTCLMSVALTHRDVPEALRIKDRMQATGARPDSRAYTTLVKGCIRWQHFDEAVDVAEEATGSLDATILADLLFVLERRGRSDLAPRVRALNAQENRGPAQRKAGVRQQRVR
jgi:pentatricopeptide repeat protein